MGLIRTGRHTPDDIEAWERFEVQVRRDAFARRRQIQRRVERSVRALHEFGSPAWVGVSWGKDSTVLAHLVAEHRPELPLCWVVTQPGENPDCWLVRDAFIERHPGITYREYADEVEVVDGDLIIDDTGNWPPCEDYGTRYVYGLRAQESRARRLRALGHGENSKNTCAPLSWWDASDVFAYLVTHDLPIHPAYGYTRGGLLDPYQLRVAPLGGQRGAGCGRRDWEWTYYEAEMANLGIRRTS